MHQRILPLSTFSSSCFFESPDGSLQEFKLEKKIYDLSSYAGFKIRSHSFLQLERVNTISQPLSHSNEDIFFSTLESNFQSNNPLYSLSRVLDQVLCQELSVYTDLVPSLEPISSAVFIYILRLGIRVVPELEKQIVQIDNSLSLNYPLTFGFIYPLVVAYNNFIALRTVILNSIRNTKNTPEICKVFKFFVRSEDAIDLSGWKT